jgi:hypothetical protein
VALITLLCSLIVSLNLDVAKLFEAIQKFVPKKMQNQFTTHHKAEDASYGFYQAKLNFNFEVSDGKTLDLVRRSHHYLLEEALY